MSDAAVLYDVDGGVAVLTLNRPDRLNAWNADMERRAFDLLEEATADPAVRVIVLTGAGRGFCAGADMTVLQGIGDTGVVGAAGGGRPTTFPMSVPKPLLAAINGACAGLGFSLALMADIRFAAAGAKFTTSFSRRGLVAEHGMSWLLPRLVGQARALDLLLSGRVFLAEEAAELGVVNRVFPPDDLLPETLAYARDMAANASPASMAAMKRQVYRHAATDFDAALTETNLLIRASLTQPDFKEGVASFVEKRPPEFAPFARGWATDW